MNGVMIPMAADMRPRTLVLILVAGLVCVGAYALLTRYTQPADTLQTVRVLRETVTNIVSVTGKVEPVDRVTLAFPVGGRIADLSVREGDQVARGQVIAQLDSGLLQAGVYEAYARLLHEQVSLRALRAPVRSEEQALADAERARAAQALDSARHTVRVALDAAYAVADQAVMGDTNALFDEARGAAAQFGLRFSYGSTAYFIGAQRETEESLNALRSVTIAALTSLRTHLNDGTSTPLTSLIVEGSETLEQVDAYVTMVAGAVNRYVAEDSVQQAVYASLQAAVSGARTRVASARSTLAAADAALTAAEASVVTADRSYERTVAGATETSVAVQEASVSVADASARVSEERLRDLVLRAPFSGTVVRVDRVSGEVVAPYTSVAELLTDDAFELDAFVPEADIAHVKLGDRARVTFDAFDQTDTFDATVMRISMGETVREGVPTYKVALSLVATSSEHTIRSGMTANIDVTTDVREGVLSVPTRSVVHRDGRTFVRVLASDGTVREQDIELGLRGSQGTVEVVRGLSEGEQVVTLGTTK